MGLKRKVKIYKIIIAISLLLVLAVPMAQATEKKNLQDAFGKDSLLDKAAGAEGAGYRTVDNPDVAAEQLIGSVIQMILSFLGVIFLILMIYGGYLWMLARGNEQQVEKSKQLITAAIVGMIIVLASFAISYFILQKFGNATLEGQGPERLGDPSEWGISE